MELSLFHGQLGLKRSILISLYRLSTLIVFIGQDKVTYIDLSLSISKAL